MADGRWLHLCFPDIVKRANVRVIQGGDRARLAVEALTELRVGRERGRQHFDRDDAIEARVARLVDFPHAARTKGGLDLVGAQPGTSR
jgi:hypothetical protein